MRIVHVVQGLGMGGRERQVVYLSRELAERGHESAIVTLSPGGAVRAEAQDVAVHDATASQVGGDPGFVARLVMLLHKLQPDVVHTHDPAPMLRAVPAAILARVRRRVHTKHGANVYGSRGLWAARALVHAVDAVVAVSPEAARVARSKERVAARRLHVLPRGIPLRAFRPDADARLRIRAELGIPEDAFVVGSVGCITPEKNYPLLVRAMTPLLAERMRLLLVGDGPARPDVERSLPRGREAFVTRTGTRSDVPALLAAMDVFVLASQRQEGDGVPLAIVEAMGCGLPVIAARTRELLALFGHDVGALVPARDELALRSAVDTMAKRPDRTQSLGRVARRWVQARSSIEQIAREYERIYQG
jgi:glycosyltransferase involved in cell wall biosynthesis